MKKRKINLIKLGILLFGISIFLINCEKDEYQEEGINGINQKILSKKINFDKIPNINAIKNSLDKIHSKNSKKTLSKSNNNLGEFIILKNEVLLMEYSETHTYTFKIIREKPEYYIENIVLHYNLETENYDEYLVQYNVNKNEYLGIINGKYINESTQIKITKLDTGTITLSGKSNCSRTCQTISLRCTAGGIHTFGDPECCVTRGTCSPLFAGAVYQSCTTTCKDNTETLSDGSNEGLASTGGGGSTGVATNPLPAEPCFEGFSGETDENGVSVCNDLIEEEESEEDLGRKKECKKITNFLNAKENKDFKDKLIELSSDANLDLNKEKSVSSFENSTTLDEREGTASNPSVSIQSNPTNKYKAFVHTHPTIGTGTLSIFSPADLIEVARLINNNKITDSFVTFLTTKKGTQYAITIQDPEKYLNFFYSQLYSNITDVPTANWNKFYSSQDKFKPLYKKYFDPDFSPKIKETDTNNENVLQEFLKFMEEANASFTLFENDKNFTTFTKVSLKNNAPKRENPCN